MRNLLLTIAYDGTNFCGWQRQSNFRTVQGEVENALSIVVGKPVEISGTSRTDSGVHAKAQCATLILDDEGIPTEHIARAVNDILAFDKLEGVSDVRIIGVKEMPEGFHARHDAKGKRYIYKINNSPEKSPFRRTQFYQVSHPLDVDAMKEATKYIVGEHDFKSFETAGSTVHESTVRNVYKLTVDKENDDITISIEGDGFLYNMVRIIVGTLVEVGLHKLSVDDVKEIIAAKDRGKAGHTAPPQGLYLDEVFF